MKQNTLKTIKSMLGKTISKTMNYSGFVKLYKSRALFKKLTRQEWLHTIDVFLLAWTVAILIVMGASKLTSMMETTWLRNLFTIFCIIIALACGNMVMHHFSPKKIKAFYS